MGVGVTSGSRSDASFPFAAMVAKEMRAHSLSNGDVADRVRKAAKAERRSSGASPQLVSRWRSGLVTPHPDHCRCIAQALGQSVKLLAAAAEAQRHGRDFDPEAFSGDHRIETPGEHLEPDTSFSSGDDSAIAALEAGLSQAAEESARFVRRAGMRVDEIALDQIDAEVRSLAKRYLSHPPHALFKPIVRLRADVFALLDTHQPPRHLRQLYLCAGQLCALLAQLNTDLGHGDAAGTHSRVAWLCADLCDNNGLRTYIRWIQAQIAYWDGNYVLAAKIARSAREFATGRTSLSRTTSQEARAWAAAGEAHQVESALAAGARADDLDDPDDLVGVFTFPRAKAAYYVSEIHLALGGANHARQAAAAAEESLSILAAEPELDGCLAFVTAARLDLVLAHLVRGSHYGEEEHLRPVLEVPTQHRPPQIVGRAEKIDAVLGDQDQSEPMARNMRDGIQM